MPAQDGDVIEVTVIHDNSTSGEQLNRYQFRVETGGPISDADLLDDIEIIVQTLYNLVKNMINVRNILREVGVFNKTQDLLIGQTTAGTYTGGGAPDPMAPSGCASFAYFKTAVPRVTLAKYLPVMSTADLSGGGNLSAASLALLTNFTSALLNPFISGVREYSYGYLSPKTLAWETPDVGVAEDIVAYQRRRKIGRGS